MAEVIGVFGGIPARNENVVQVDERERNVPEDAVHEMLEGLGGVLESKGHPYELPEAERGDDGRLGNGVRCYRDVMISTHEVHFGEDGRPGKVDVEIFDVGQRVAIIGGRIVQAAVVSAWSPASAGLRGDVKRR